MKLRQALAPAALVLALGHPAAAAEGYWASIFADLVSGPVQKQEFQWTGAVRAGQTVEIKGVNGSIMAGPASGSRIEVAATKRGRRNKPEEVQVKVVEHAGGVTICAVYPTPEGARPNECAPGGGGRMSVRNNDVNVDFTVKVPRDAKLVLTTVNGAVDASGLGGDVEATTVNGSVKLVTAGVARAETVNGSLHIVMGRADWTDTLKFETVNGSIRIDFPASLSANVDAEVVNGSIDSDFEVSGGKATRRKLTGTIGRGGRALELETVNGSVVLRRGQ